MVHFEDHPLNPGLGSPVFIADGVIKEPGQLTPFYEIEDPLAAPLIKIGSKVNIVWGGNAKGGSNDFIYYPELGMAGNSRGLPDSSGIEGLEDFREPIRILSSLGIKTVISVSNLPFQRPVDVIPELLYRAAEVNPTAVEVNLSCPNGQDEDGNLHPAVCTNEDATEEVLAAGREAVGEDICLGGKDSSHSMSPELPVDREEASKIALTIARYCNFVTGINTIPNMPFPELTCSNGRGGMSGPIVAPVARQHLAVYQEVAPDLAYLSCGGVDSQNAHEEISLRLNMGALRVGGAQEFYRTKQKHLLAARWTIAAS